MEKLLRELKETSGTNDKCAILERVKNDKDVLRCFKLCYDPFTRFYINKIELPPEGHLDFRHSVNEFYNVCNRLSTRESTGNAARELVDFFLSKCQKETQELYVKILRKDLKVGVTDTLMNRVYGDDFIEVFEVQLANQYDAEKRYKTRSKGLVPHWFASPKMDGLRCFYKNGMLLTRNGHEIFGFDHIIEELKQLPFSFVDGELFSKEVKFQKIQGAVMQNKNIDPAQKSMIFFNVFAVGGDWKSVSGQDTELMVDALRTIKDRYAFKYVRAIEYTLVANHADDITRLCGKYMKEGYEGAMLRHPEIWYEWKRSNSLLKFKLFREEDFKCVGFVEGTKGTKYEGMLGTIIVEGSVRVAGDTTEKVTIRSEVGSGFDDEDRVEIWKNRDEYLGKSVEIKFQALTDDNSSLRFPVYKAWKLDR